MPTFGWKSLILGGKECSNLVNHKITIKSDKISMNLKKWGNVGASVKFLFTKKDHFSWQDSWIITPLNKFD